MYKCLECGYIFEIPRMYNEDCTPYGGSAEQGFINEYQGCPNCGGNYEEADECSICGECDFVKNGEYIKDGFICEKCLEDDENE